ncbi:MAG: winged helix-turn-helix transcriptional regulator [bacterium]|nr:winged helix-turn-helix transcriptional regulator [bacterium]
MKAQDILILLKIQSLCDQAGGDAPVSWSQRQLAEATGISLSQVNAACRRLELSGLLLPGERKVVRSGLLKFLVHGLEYVFPVQMGAVVRGMPTGYAAEPLKGEFLLSEHELAPVWSDAQGSVRGLSFKPIYRTAPMAARKDQRLYEYLVLIDAIRGGRARERAKAIEILTERLGG